MDIGKMRHRITLYAPSAAPGTAGETQVTYTAVRTVWAAVKTETARELVRNNRVEAELAYLIGCRYAADVRESWRIGYEGRTLEISKVIDPDQRRWELQILAHEVRAG